MTTPPETPQKGLSLSGQFTIASFIILLIVAFGLGWWVTQRIETSVIHRTAETTALFVDSFIAPNLQELATSDTLKVEHVAALGALLDDTPLGQNIVSFKVWDRQGKVLYSADAAAIGQIFPLTDELQEAWSGNVSSHISNLEKAENLNERAQDSQLLETYSPVRDSSGERIIAVAEFYQSVDDLQEDVAAAREQSWLVVAAAMLVIFLLMSGFVRRASNTIEQQRLALHLQVLQLTDYLQQNLALHGRVRRAAARVTALNERVLRRISADLHDGPIQEISLALLRLDHVAASVPAGPQTATGAPVDQDLEVVQGSLQRALAEIRALSAGMGVPHLNELTLPETVTRAVTIHENRTQTVVALSMSALPEQTSLPVKITVFRLVQEALNNAFHHAGGQGQRVEIRHQDGELHIEVADSGPGFSPQESDSWEEHLGLAGMRERVESLGGTFYLESPPGDGAHVIAILPLPESMSLQNRENGHERANSNHLG